jgi:hypothetical protein
MNDEADIKLAKIELLKFSLNSLYELYGKSSSSHRMDWMEKQIEKLYAMIDKT